MEDLLEKVIKNAYKLQFIENKNKVMTSDCFEPNEEEDDYYKFADLIRYKKIPHNDAISFKPILPRFGLLNRPSNRFLRPSSPIINMFKRKKTADTKNDKSREPKNSAFHQQLLQAWQPLLTVTI